MLFKNRIEHLEDIFLRQFERQGNDLFYRKYGRAAPIPVTEEEKEEFRLQYRKAATWMIFGSVASVMLAITLGVLIAPEFMDEGPGIIVISGGTIGAIAILSVRIRPRQQGH